MTFSSSSSWTNVQSLVPWGLVCAATLIGACADIHSRRIPNWLTAPVFLGGLAWSCLSRGLEGMGDAFLASLILALPYVVLFLFAGGGAGDAKLMAGVGAWLGIKEGLYALVAIALCGIVLAIIFAIKGKETRSTLQRLTLMLHSFVMIVLSRGRFRSLSPAVDKINPETRTIPYGVAICAGVVVAGSVAILSRFPT